MKNKYELKKCIRQIIIVVIVLLLLFLIIDKHVYQNNVNNINIKLLNIIENIKHKYPDLKDEDIYDILNNDNLYDEEFADKFSVDITKESLISGIDEVRYKYQLFIVIYFVLSIIIITYIFLKYNAKKDKDIKSLTSCIEQINQNNYQIDIDEMSEDELSILKSEIYKTTILLKQQADNSLKDKLQLKDSLSDISHQLKTPLTAIMIRLDNLIDYPDMDIETKNLFIKQIKMEINNVNFFIQSILKLSKLESNTVEYVNSEVKISEIVIEAINHLLPLCDLKNVAINLNNINDALIYCDKIWQVEAITNILKNSIEHSSDGDVVDVSIDSNLIYASICIKDYGTGISKDNLKHIFDRFYNADNSSGVGIGLSLAKSIINKNNGTISVDSTINKGSCFTIKYYKI